jgi:RNA polymerase sigma-70 factor (ECF subfamily)
MAGRESETSASLLLRLRDARDGDAWDSFVAVYGPLVRRHCVRRGLQDSDAADVAQEVFARVAKAIRSFEYAPERGRFRGWLGTVVANEIATFRAKAGRRPADGGTADDAPGPDPSWDRAFTEHVLAVASDAIRPEFEPNTWAAFEATWVKGERPEDVAKRLGTAIHAVYVNKSRVLKRLEAEVMRLADDLPLTPDRPTPRAP